MTVEDGLAEIRARLDALEQRVNKLEGKDEEKPAEDEWEKSYREHLEAKREEERRDLVRRTKVAMQHTASGP